MNFIDINSFTELIIRFSFNLIVILIIVRWLYYSNHKRRDLVFTFILLNIILFLLCFLISNLILQIGFALGLVAMFIILRYLTVHISLHDITYLIVVIGISIINSLTTEQMSYSVLLFSNLVVIIMIFILEKLWLKKNESIKTIVYEKINLIKPDKRKELIEDIEKRTGLKIHRIEIGRIDFLRDIARIRIHYYNSDNIINQADASESEDLFNEDVDD